MEYKQLSLYESHTDFGSLGIKIMVSVNRELDDADNNLARKVIDQLVEGIWRRTLAQDPKQTEAKLAEQAKLMNCFSNRQIFVEPIPNGYCNRWCCSQKPWYRVTTYKGIITIGWRKSVIHVSWDPEVADEAEKLFPDQNVTKYERLIHAWGYDKAKEYINKILEA